MRGTSSVGTGVLWGLVDIVTVDSVCFIKNARGLRAVYKRGMG